MILSITNLSYVTVTAALNLAVEGPYISFFTKLGRKFASPDASVSLFTLVVLQNTL